MIRVYKEAFKAPATSAFNGASALKALIHVYHTLFFIPALQSGNYNKKSKLKHLFRSNLCR
jgi:hypothetical protein